MGIILKKSLGQHFLINESICVAIVNAILHENPLNLVEVGPGGGAITKYFLQKENINFIAIELDNDKVQYLQKKYPTIKGKLINQSILEIEKPFALNFSVVGNFPYNISTEILFKMLEWRAHVDCIVGMFQKEVAQRVAAKEGSKIYGVTSVLLQTYFSVEYLFDVPENAFKPPPKVKSGVIKLKPLTNPVDIKSYEKLSTLVKTAFNQRRKTLRNAVKSLFETSNLEDEIFNKRAEQLSVQDFAMLTYKMR
jgi:16S rRNA (adenine1518-N6/adenine1519-N6)-dimethyltransferase